MKCLHNIWRKLVFWVGDVRRISHFPFVTWDVHEHKVDYAEIYEALVNDVIKPGDVGIHLDLGFLSNIAIPSSFTHAWIHVGNKHIVEAISDGVVKRHAIYPMHSDYVVILRPKDVTDKELLKAIVNAENIVGQKYDVNFAFDIEEEVKIFGGNEIVAAKENVVNWDGGFSCTETVSYSYWSIRDKLRLYRKRVRGKDVITADQFINNGFEIVWLSKSVTVEAVKKLKLHEEGVSMVEKYWESKKELF